MTLSNVRFLHAQTRAHRIASRLHRITLIHYMHVST